jgi:hypothetical protein
MTFEEEVKMQWKIDLDQEPMVQVDSDHVHRAIMYQVSVNGIFYYNFDEVSIQVIFQESYFEI